MCVESNRIRSTLFGESINNSGPEHKYWINLNCHNGERCLSNKNDFSYLLPFWLYKDNAVQSTHMEVVNWRSILMEFATCRVFIWLLIKSMTESSFYRLQFAAWNLIGTSNRILQCEASFLLSFRWPFNDSSHFILQLQYFAIFSELSVVKVHPVRMVAVQIIVISRNFYSLTNSLWWVEGGMFLVFQKVSIHSFPFNYQPIFHNCNRMQRNY